MNSRISRAIILAGALAIPASASAQQTDDGVVSSERQITQINAEPGNFGLGLGGSTLISGLSGKYYWSERNAIQGVVGYFSGYGFGAGLDGIREMPVFFQNQTLSINWNLGIGGFGGGTEDTASLGLSGIVGLGGQFRAVPIEVVLELRPTLFLNFLSEDVAAFGDVFGRFVPFGGGGNVRWFF